MRLDRALVARGLVRSRTHARSLIDSGRALVDGQVEFKSSRMVADGQTLSLTGEGNHYVSRAAHKLLGALDALAPLGSDVSGRRCLDAGASTGGFTQVLLERGATHVLALDVGHGQMDPDVASDPRVSSREGVNVRDLPPPEDDGVDLVVADLSFISLTLAIGPLSQWVRPGGNALLLVKPQFEVGAGRLGKGGVVRDADAQLEAVSRVTDALAAGGLAVLAVLRSVVSGADGNVEFFVWSVKPWQAGGGAAVPGPPPLDGQGLREAIAREVYGSP